MNAFPEFFGTGEETMFGWVHPPAPDLDRGTVVVLCPPLGFDYICTYRSWRILAERLAEAGFGVLRFDYLGTGDSAGDAEAPQQVLRWQQSVTRAAAHARARTGANRVALVGLRLGATLAACGASGIPDVDSLVLWSPLRSGRRYAREVDVLARLSRPESDGDCGDVEAAGFLVTQRTLKELRDLDVMDLLDRPASRVLLVDRDDFSPDHRLLSHLEHLGCIVTRDRTPGTRDALVQPIQSKVPEQILDRIVAWLIEGHPGPRVDVPVRLAVAGDAGRGDGWREQPLFFGAEGRLFGVLTRPISDEPISTVVVLLNTGCEYRVGPHRMYVPLARAWAREGCATLRFDIGGIGDSRPPAGALENNAYPAHAMEDISAAVVQVREMTKAGRLLVLGICSGGWHAFRAARDGLAIDGIMAINPPLYLREGPHYALQELVEEQELGRYGRSIADPEKWLKVLRGRASVGTFARLAAMGARRWLWGQVAGVGSQTAQDNLGGDLLAIATRGMPVQFVFSETDLGLNYFQLQVRGLARRVRGRITCAVVPGGDHTFRPLPAQQTLRRLMGEFLKSDRARV